MQFEYSCMATVTYFAVIESDNLFASFDILFVINICLLWAHISILRFGTNKSTVAPTYL